MGLRALITLLLLSLGSALALGPASATGSSYTVSVGGSSSPGTHPVTGTTSGTIMWQTPTLTLSCASANVPASPPSTVVSGASVVQLLQIDKVNYVSCVFPGGALTVTTTGTWVWHGTGVATSGSSDIVTGHLENVTATWGNAVCKFTVTGSMNGVFNEATQQLQISETGFTGNLKVSNVIGCLGQIRSGQLMNYSMTVNIVSPDGVINFQ